MVESQKKKIVKIDSETQIIFTLKNLVTIIGSIVGLLITFYKFVIDPRLIELDNKYEKLYTEQRQLYSEVTKINIGIARLHEVISSDGTFYIFTDSIENTSILTKSPQRDTLENVYPILKNIENTDKLW